MIYVIFIIDHIHQLLNESKMWIFVYNNDRIMYTLLSIIQIYMSMLFKSIQILGDQFHNIISKSQN